MGELVGNDNSNNAARLEQTWLDLSVSFPRDSSGTITIPTITANELNILLTLPIILLDVGDYQQYWAPFSITCYVTLVSSNVMCHAHSVPLHRAGSLLSSRGIIRHDSLFRHGCPSLCEMN